MEEIKGYKETNISFSDRLLQKIWVFSSYLLFKPFGFNFLNFWRVFVLRVFGSKIGKGSIVYSSVFIPAPWNLEMGQFSCLGPGVKLHIDKTIIGNKVTVSQRSYLCSGSHDIKYLSKPFISRPIVLEDYSWIAAEAFVGPGVTIGKGAIVGARSVVFRDIDPWSVVAGNPAILIKKRNVFDA